MDVMLTTVDNPHSPFDDYDRWYVWDGMLGHHSTSFLARVAVLSDDMSDEDQEVALALAIDEIVKENVSGVWRKVTREDYQTPASRRQ